MFDKFTEKAIKVIMLAQEESRRLGHNFVGTEQLLLGLIGEGTGFSAKVLRAFGVNLKDTRIEVEKITGRGSGFVAVEIPFTARAKRVLELALAAARDLGHNYIGTEHLLLGIIREGEGVAARVLENFGINLEELHDRAIEAIEDGSGYASLPEIDLNKSNELVNKIERLLAIFENAQYEGTDLSDRLDREFNKRAFLNNEIAAILNNLPESTSVGSEMKQFLTDLKMAIETSLPLNSLARESALEMILIIAEACQDLQDSRQQKLAIKALKLLQVTINRAKIRIN